MERMLTVRFLDHPDDRGLVVPSRTARRLIRAHARTSHVCALSSESAFTLDVLEQPRQLPADATEIWLLRRDSAA